VKSPFVASEAGRIADKAARKGRLVPVLLDAAAERLIPLPFGEFQHFDLTSWGGAADDPTLRKLASVVGRLAKRPHQSSEWGQNLQDDWSVKSARSAATEMRRLGERVGSVGEVLAHGAAGVDDVRAALAEVHKTLDVVSDAVEQFVAAGLADVAVDVRPYVRFERGKLARAIRQGKGHCDLIALHYGRREGVREWLEEHAPKRVLSGADQAFGRLSEADNDLFVRLAEIGTVLTNESRVIVNLVVGEQHGAARQRVIDGRTRLAPLEAELDRSSGALADVEQSLGFSPSV
jgi:hypothetical protein